MSRLIDADKLQEDLEKVKKESATLVDLLHIIEFQIVVDAQSTAFDVDKVVEQLDALDNAEVDYYSSNDVIDRIDAIDIVRNGGNL